MAKQVLKTLDLTTLLVALDHLDDYGPNATAPDPESLPDECVYLTHIGETHVAALAQRLLHIDVFFPEAGVVRKVFHKQAIFHVFQFAFPNGPDFTLFVRDLASLNKRYWRLLDAAGKPVRRKRTNGKS